MGEERGAYRILVGKPEGKRPLGRPRRRYRIRKVRNTIYDNPRGPHAITILIIVTDVNYVTRKGSLGFNPCCGD